MKPSRDEQGNVHLLVDRTSPKAPKLAAALEAWMKQIESLDAGEITQTEFEAWKAETK